MRKIIKPLRQTIFTCVSVGLLLGAVCAARQAWAVPSLQGLDAQSEKHSEVTVDANGVKWVCEDGVCRIVDDGAGKPDAGKPAPALPEKPTRMILGSRGVDEFLAFLGETDNSTKPPAEEEKVGAFGSFTWLTLLLALVGGLALNLTPCVLPMIPVP